MLRTLAILCILLTIPALNSHAFRRATYKTGETVMNEMKNKQGASSEIELIRMTVVDESGNTDVREILSAIKPDAQGNLRYLIRILSPDQVKGVTLLTLQKTDGETEQWFYLPALGTPRKITGNQKNGYFLGSDFTFEDLRRENPKDHDYYRLLDEEINGRPVYVVMSAPAGLDAQTASAYANRLVYIDKATLEISRVEFYDEGKTTPSKVFQAYDFQEAEPGDSATRPTRVVMDNREKKTHSVMTLVKSRLNVPIDDALFDPALLDQWQPERDKQLLSAFDESVITVSNNASDS